MTTQNQTTLHPVNIAKVNAWLDEHWKGSRACPVCGNTHWGFGPEVVEVRNFNSARRHLGDEETVCPLVLVVCSTCSYTMFFNALVVGAVEREN